MINSFFCKQFKMGAVFRHFAVVYDDYTVGITQSGKTMSYHNCSSSSAHESKRFLYPPFSSGTIALVASSRISIFGFFSKALAMGNALAFTTGKRFVSTPDKRFICIRVFYYKTAERLAALAASNTSSSVASGFA